MWERIKNSLTEGSNTFAGAFKDGFVGASTTVGDFNSKMGVFSTNLNETMKTAGESFGKIVGSIAELTPWIEGLIVTFTTYKVLLSAIISAQKLYEF